ncbi:uncharacterized protein LOC126966981 [Leptidea sinapis]|uniref:uncharacterized protein LOC126966981 n=1 Tax=Leptidea sinapis TaxID=189913 RepID=UPI0021C327DD|nr:uncharacterized protein LOC126966981 [Leptidea sinapis]
MPVKLASPPPPPGPSLANVATSNNTTATTAVPSAGNLSVPQLRDVAGYINPSVSLTSEARSNNSILLSTAQVFAKPQGRMGRVVVRCLIDNGSQNNLITVECCRKLNLSIVPLCNSFVKGVGMSSRPIHGYVYVEIESRLSTEYKYKIYALVVDCITDELPSRFIKLDNDLRYFDKLPLADLTWNIPGNIDIILGAQLFPYIYLGNKLDIGPRAPPALSTVFGYVFMGDYPSQKNDNIARLCTKTASLNESTASAEFNCNVTTASFISLNLNDLIQRFWQLEELLQSEFLSPEETECENLYTSTVTRDDTGRYVVSLPFCKVPSEHGNSRAVALRRLLALERRFRQDVKLRDNYNKVIQEYMDNGYLSSISESEVSDTGYYIPHHAIVRSDKPMPRVVLDASAKTHTGLSLNDVLHVGRNMQTDLFLLLLEFRLFPVAMNADIKHMYLRIGVFKDQRKYIRILFRFNENENICTFEFNCVPFGLKSSPFLAMRTVRQLASDMSPTSQKLLKLQNRVCTQMT